MNILRFILLEDLVCHISLVNKRLHALVFHTASLWINISFTHLINLNEHSLRLICDKACSIQELNLIYQGCEVNPNAFDKMLNRSLISAKGLRVLYVDSLPLSSLDFLTSTINLCTLSISDCANIGAREFLNIQSCATLTHLDVSFTCIRAEILLNIVKHLPNLENLLAAGICFTCGQFFELFQAFHNSVVPSQFLQVSFHPNEAVHGVPLANSLETTKCTINVCPVNI